MSWAKACNYIEATVENFKNIRSELQKMAIDVQTSSIVKFILEFSFFSVHFIDIHSLDIMVINVYILL